MSPLTQQSRVLKPFGLHVKLEAVGPLFFPSSRCDTNGHVVQLDAKLSSFAWLELKQVDCIMQTLVFDNCKLVVVPVERKIQTSCRKLWDVLLGADEHFRRRWQLDGATSNGMDRVKLDFYPPFFTNLLHELVTMPSWKDAGVRMGYNANGEACVLNLEITEISALYNSQLVKFILSKDQGLYYHLVGERGGHKQFLSVFEELGYDIRCKAGYKDRFVVAGLCTAVLRTAVYIRL